MNKPLQPPAATGRAHSLSGLPLDRMMTDASIDQIIALDLELKVQAWNRACELVTGISRADAIGRPLAALFPGIEDCSSVTDALTYALKGLKSFVPWTSGSYLKNGYFEQHFVPLCIGSDCVGVLVIMHDVAHRIKAEQELQRLNAELSRRAAELQRSRGELASFNWIASHDLKEPLRKIYMFIEMVVAREGAKLSADARGNLRRAQSSVQRMGLLTDDIAIFSQVAVPSEASAPVALEQVLTEAREKHRKDIEEKGALITTGPLPEIVAYPALIRLLFAHLLGNAVKFQAADATPAVQISYALVPGSALNRTDADMNAQYHSLTFRDNGIGFAPQYAEKIFGMFQRLHPQGSYKGTGMGLTICRKVAEAHEGYITASSEEGKGSEFTAYLKVAAHEVKGI